MQRRDLNANDAPPPVAAYTQAIEVTGAASRALVPNDLFAHIETT
jgi:2-iminobutanoate/2-iminopropanoate deaminase